MTITYSNESVVDCANTLISLDTPKFWAEICNCGGYVDAIVFW